jgi:Tat protein translocase TatB subunit
MDFLGIGIGTSEILVLVVLALIVFGPQRLPEMARHLSKAMRMFREASREIQSQLEMTDWDNVSKKNNRKAIPRKTQEKTAAPEGTSSSPDPYVSSSGSTSPSTPEKPKDEYTSPYKFDTEPSSSNPSTESVIASAEPLDDPAKEKDAQRYSRELSD